MRVQNESSTIFEDDVNLYDLWRRVVKKRKIVIGLFIMAIVFSTVLSLLLPRVYRGEVILKVNIKDSISSPKELIDLFGKIDRERIKRIFAKNHETVRKVMMSEIKGSADKLKVTIDSRNPDSIQDSLIEIAEYMNNSPETKFLTDLSRERLTKQLEEISQVILQSEVLVRGLEKMLKEGRLLPVGFNPIDLSRKVSDLRMEKLYIEQTLTNLKAIKIIEPPFISREACKSKGRSKHWHSRLIKSSGGCFISSPIGIRRE